MVGSIRCYQISLDNKNDLKRYAQVTSLVNEKTIEYENSWTIEKTLLASRIIKILDIECDLTKKENAKEIIKACKQNYKKMKEFLDSNQKPDYKFYFYVKVKDLWIGDWHEIMIKNNKSYNNLTDRIIAVQSISRNSTFSIYHYLDKLPEIVELNGFVSPHNWRESQIKEEILTCCNGKCAKILLKKEIKFCECKKVVYCSKDCQIIHWKRKHKNKCESYKKEA